MIHRKIPRKIHGKIHRNRSHQNRAARAGLIALITLLAGCTLLPEPSPQDIYRLPPPSLQADPGPAVAVSLRVARPVAAGMLRGERIVVVPDDNLLSVYQGARWNAPAPMLWRDHLLDAFRHDGRIERLSSDAESLQADRELGGTLRAFQTEYRNGRPHAVIQLDVQLIDAASRRILDSRRFSVTEALDGEQAAAAVDALGRASDALIRELIDWTVQRLENPAAAADR